MPSLFIITIIVVQGDNFGAMSNDVYKVCKHHSPRTDLELSRYAKPIWLQLCVFAEVTWIKGAYGSYHIKNPFEDQMFEYDALTLEEWPILII